MALIAQYLFNDNANDSSGNGKNGTAYNLTYENAPYGLPFLGKVSLYNGSTSYIDLPVLSSSNTEARTIIFNIYPNNISVNQCYFSMGWGDDGGRGLRIGYSSDYYLTVWNYLNYFGGSGIKPATMAVNTWHQVGVSWQTGTNNVKVYLNGNFVGQFTHAGSDITGETFGIGRERMAGTFYANGKTNNLRYYNEIKNATFFSDAYLEEFSPTTTTNYLKHYRRSRICGSITGV